jgi:CRP-like cAMP-binding protein
MGRREIDPQPFLASLPLFQAVQPATLARIAAATRRIPLRRGERVFSRGDQPTGMYVVVFGEIRLLAHGARGARLAGVVEAGRSFGEPVMFLERRALVDAEAATDALVLHVSKEAVFAEIERDPRFARRMIAGLSRRIEAMVLEEERHAEAVVTLPASKAATASHLRLTPEHLSRLLRELAAEGVLRVEGRRIALLRPKG